MRAAICLQQIAWSFWERVEVWERPSSEKQEQEKKVEGSNVLAAARQFRDPSAPAEAFSGMTAAGVRWGVENEWKEGY